MKITSFRSLHGFDFIDIHSPLRLHRARIRLFHCEGRYGIRIQQKNRANCQAYAHGAAGKLSDSSFKVLVLLKVDACPTYYLLL